MKYSERVEIITEAKFATEQEEVAKNKARLDALIGKEVRLWSNDGVIHIDGQLEPYGTHPEGLYRILVYDGQRVSSALFFTDKIDWSKAVMDGEVACLHLKESER